MCWHAQAHGNATAYAFMLDADFVVREPWRLRITAQRMVAECAKRSVEECGKGMKVLPPGVPACSLELCKTAIPPPEFTPVCLTLQDPSTLPRHSETGSAMEVSCRKPVRDAYF